MDINFGLFSQGDIIFLQNKLSRFVLFFKMKYKDRESCGFFWML